MDETLIEILDLQKQWSAKNTEAMKSRGVLVRNTLPDRLRQHTAALAAALGVPESEVGVEGRDGTGLKTEVPWTRVYLPQRSSSATNGWYLVYLFSAQGERVYLSLIQGTSRWTGADFAPRSPEELAKRVAWARPLLKEMLSGRDDLVEDIDLQATKSKVARGYAAGSVIAIEYDRHAMPHETILVEDLLFMARLLRAVHQGEDTAPHVPGDAPPEVLDATDAAAKTAGRRTKAAKGQGFRLSAPDRRALELHSVGMATAYFEAQGWSVKDVGATESYDLLLKRGDERLHVEVKGTTSEGAQVILTRAEVDKQRELAPENALVVVHSIHLDRSVSPPTASGGVLHCTSPWEIEEEDLTVVSYIYRSGVEQVSE
ncbi:MrcB family domain-containing protein [Nocardiopsis dassonvillei]|uniref:MrcB family domain-containing protein n=1 Tax=Nocardiopsis dassonvillei TaxID=2014 RepID=UPI00366D8A9C